MFFLTRPQWLSLPKMIGRESTLLFFFFEGRIRTVLGLKGGLSVGRVRSI